MAHEHARRYGEIPEVELVAACDVVPDQVKDFCARHGIPEAYTRLEDLLEQSEAEAVSIVTPDSTHKLLSLRALAAGRHVLCEKPLATTATDAREMARAAQQSGRIHMVNFTYRNSSAWQTAVERIQRGQIGRVLHFEGRYLQSWLTTTNWDDWKTSPRFLWRLSRAHGSHGALGDIGVHLVDFVTGLVGDPDTAYCHFQTFDKVPGNRLGDYVLDANDSALITLSRTDGPCGCLSVTRCATGHDNSVSVSVHGDKGALRLELDRGYSRLESCQLDADGKWLPWTEEDCGTTPNVWERFVAAVRTGRPDQPDFVRGARVQEILEACQESASSEKRVALPDSSLLAEGVPHQV